MKMPVTSMARLPQSAGTRGIFKTTPKTVLSGAKYRYTLIPRVPTAINTKRIQKPKVSPLKIPMIRRILARLALIASP
jgi:hypothetical protein